MPAWMAAIKANISSLLSPPRLPPSQITLHTDFWPLVRPHPWMVWTLKATSCRPCILIVDHPPIIRRSPVDIDPWPPINSTSSFLVIHWFQFCQSFHGYLGWYIVISSETSTRFSTLFYYWLVVPKLIFSFLFPDLVELSLQAVES